MFKLTIAILLLIGSLTASTSVNAKKCAACHGQNGEKIALGKSKVISQMSAKDIEYALKGYKAGTYGSSMRSLMKAQVLNLSNDDMDALGKHFSKVK